MDKIKLLNAARFTYKYGDSIMTDLEFDKLLSEVNGELVNWEEIEFKDVAETLTELGWNINTYLETLDTAKKEEDLELQNLFPVKTSMEMLTEETVLRDKYLSQFQDLNSDDILLMMYKIDGWGISVYYEPNNPIPVFAKTRGRGGGQYTVITKLMQLIAPKLYVDRLTEITGELALKKDSLEILRDRYPNKNFVNVRNSVSTFVYKTIDINKEYHHLTFFAFNKEEELLPSEGTKIDDLKWLAEKGFTVPPCALTSVNGYENAFLNFQDYYEKEFSKLYEADGLVLQNNYKDNAKNMKSVTSLGIPNLVALKFGVWAQEELIGKVKEVIFPSGKVRNGCVIIIEPITNRIGNTIKRVNGYNLATVLKYKVDKGSFIKIGCHSQQNIVIIGLPTAEEMERI